MWIRTLRLLGRLILPLRRLPRRKVHVHEADTHGAIITDQVIDVLDTIADIDIGDEESVLVGGTGIESRRQTDLELFEANQFLPDAIGQRQVYTQPTATRMGVNTHGHIETGGTICPKGDTLGPHDDA